MSNQVDIQTIQNQLNYLSETKNQLKTALIEKGLEVTDDTPLREYATHLSNMDNIMCFNTMEELQSKLDVADGTLALVYKNGGRKINTETFKGPIYLPRILDVGMDIEELSRQMGWLTTSAVSNYWGGTTNPFYIKDEQNKTVLYGSVRCEHYNYSNNTDRYLYRWTFQIYREDGTTFNLKYDTPAGKALRNYTYYTLDIAKDLHGYLLENTSAEHEYHFELGANEKGVPTSPMVSMLFRSGDVEFAGMFRFDGAKKEWYQASIDSPVTATDVWAGKFMGINGIETGTLNSPKAIYDSTKADIKTYYTQYEVLFKTIDTSAMPSYYNFSKDCLPATASYIPFINVTSNATNLSKMFLNARNITYLSLNHWDTSRVTNASEMFMNTGSISGGNRFMNTWNMINCTNMANMFSNAGSIGGFAYIKNTSNCTNMAFMFNGCTSDLNYALFDGYNTCNVTNMAYMFSNCGNARKIAVNHFNMSNVLNLTHMFDNCYFMNEVHNYWQSSTSSPQNWYPSKCINMAFMFNNCQSLTWLNFPNRAFGTICTNHANMFANCISFNGFYYLAGININTSLNTSNMFANCRVANRYLVQGSLANVIDASNMFANCLTLNYNMFNKLNFTMPNVTTISNMFANCKALTKMPSINWNMPNLTNASYMFSNSGITSLTITGADLPNITSMTQLLAQGISMISTTVKDSVFNGVKTLNVGASSKTVVFDNVKINNSDYLTSLSGFAQYCPYLESLTIKNMDLSNVTTMASMFTNSNNLTSISLPANFTFTNVTNMYNTFFLVGKLQNLDLIKGKDLSNITNLSQAFQGMYNLRYFTDMNVQLSNVVNLANTFRSDSNLVSVNMDCNNTTTVTTLSNMFYACSRLNDVVLNLSTSNCTTLQGMLNDCYLIKSLSIADFNTSNCTGLGNVFYNCSNLIDVDLTKFRFDKATSTIQTFYRCSNIANWNFDNPMLGETITNTYSMFESSSINNASQFIQLNLPNLTSMSRMFHSCKQLEPDFVLQNVTYDKLTSMGGMFTSCDSLQTVTLSDISMPVFNNFYECFRLCNNLTTVNLSNISTNATSVNVRTMFIQCNNLTDVVMTNFLNNVKDVGGMFFYCNNLTDESIDNIITWLLTNTAPTYKNLSTSNSNSPFWNTSINSSRYASRLQELTDAGWTY
jgi:hypothetical protein